MSIAEKLLARQTGEAKRSFEFSLVVPGDKIYTVKGDVLSADSAEYKSAEIEVKRLWAESKINGSDYAAELIARISTNVTIDDESIDNDTLKNLCKKYSRLVEALDKESSQDTVFTVQPQSNSSSTQSGKRGSTSQHQKTQK